MFDVIEHMFDVIVNEVRKYSPNTRKLEAKADKQFERLDLITIVQVKLEATQSNILPGLTCKDEFTSNPDSSREVSSRTR